MLKLDKKCYGYMPHYIDKKNTLQKICNFFLKKTYFLLPPIRFRAGSDMGKEKK